MSLILNDSIRVAGGKPVEDKRLNNGVPYNSIAEAKALISKANRYVSLEVVVKSIDGTNFIYWWKDGIEDNDLTLKVEGGEGATMPSVLVFKDVVPLYDDLSDVINPETGWVYGVEEHNALYVYIENYNGGVDDVWKNMGVTIDFSDYYTKTEVYNKDEINANYYTKPEVDSKNAGKIDKEGINLGDTGNIPEMKTGAISGIYRGNGGSNSVYEYSPFLQMTTADTFAQLHFRYNDGEMSYRAGNADNGYSALRTSWDNVNLVNPATQSWADARYPVKYENAAGVGFTNGNINEAPYIFHSSGNYAFLATQSWVTSRGYLQISNLTGLGNRVLQSNPAGEVSANLTVEELYVTESDIIGAINAISDSTWVSNNNTVSISPSTNVFKRGRIYINNGFRYEATNDNIVLRLGGASSSGGSSNVTVSYGGGSDVLGPQLTGTTVLDSLINGSGGITATAGWKYKSFDIPTGYSKIRFNNIGIRPESTPSGYYRFLNSSGTLISGAFGSFNSNEDKTITIPQGAVKFEIDIKSTSDTDAVYSNMSVWAVYIAPDYVTSINGKPLTIASSTVSGVPTNQSLNTNDSVQFSHITASSMTLLNIPTDRALVAVGELYIDVNTEQIKVKLT